MIASAIAAGFAVALATAGDSRIQTELPLRADARDRGGAGLRIPGGGTTGGRGRDGPAGVQPTDSSTEPAGTPRARDTGGTSGEPAGRRTPTERESPESSLRLPAPPPGGLGNVAFLLLASAVVIAVIVALARLFTGRTPPPIEIPSASPVTPAEDSRAVLPIGSAAALANSGRFTEAVHVLLIDAIGILGSGAPPPDSRTSRELLRHFRLRGSAQEDFAAVVSAVERSLFGGRRLAREDYDVCADRVDRLRRSSGRNPGSA